MVKCSKNLLGLHKWRWSPNHTFRVCLNCGLFQYCVDFGGLDYHIKILGTVDEPKKLLEEWGKQKNPIKKLRDEYEKKAETKLTWQKALEESKK